MDTDFDFFWGEDKAEGILMELYIGSLVIALWRLCCCWLCWLDIPLSWLCESLSMLTWKEFSK